MKKKPIFNIFLKVFLPLLIVLTILLLPLTYLMFWLDCNDVSAADREVSESGTLDYVMVLQGEEDGVYYDVFEITERRTELIAFRVTQEQMGDIPYMEPSYYPVAYWNGPYQTLDLSQGYDILKDFYRYRDADWRLPQMTQVKVYDFSAYKGHTQDMGRGPIIGVVLLWALELMVGGILILLDLAVGLIIVGVNRKRKMNR